MNIGIEKVYMGVIVLRVRELWGVIIRLDIWRFSYVILDINYLVFLKLCFF